MQIKYRNVLDVTYIGKGCIHLVTSTVGCGGQVAVLDTAMRGLLKVSRQRKTEELKNPSTLPSAVLLFTRKTAVVDD